MTTDNFVCTLDAEDWQLYSDMKGAKGAASDLSGSLTGLINEAISSLKTEPLLSERKLARQIFRKMDEHFERLSAYGASDGEPSSVLAVEINEALRLKGEDRINGWGD